MTVRVFRLSWGLLAACASGPGASTPAVEQARLARSAEQAQSAVNGEPWRPCARDSEGYRAALTAFNALDATIDALSPAGDPSSANDQLQRLMQMPCMELAYDSLPPELVADTGLSMKTFWDQGKGVLGGALDMREVRHVAFAPTMRKTLALETRAGDPLADDMLCSVADAACGTETRGWQTRAEHILQGVADLGFRPDRPDPPSQAQIADCANIARAKAPLAQFDAFRACLAARIVRADVLPLGATRAPSQGWFVVRGRRGHYSFCDEVRAYDLENGAAFIVGSCSALALDGPMVDQEKTDAGRKQQAQRGFVLRDNLREAVWMAVLSREVQARAMVGQKSIKLPDDIEPVVQTRLAFVPPVPEAQYSSGLTTLAWSFTHDGHTLAEGILHWDTDLNDASRAYAVELLAIAEASFLPGCPTRMPPMKQLLEVESPGVSIIDGDRAALNATNQLLNAAFEAEAKRPCTATARLPQP